MRAPSGHPRRLPLLALLLAACGSDVSVVQAPDDPACDGVKQEGEETVDAPFDADGDGFFDGANPDCQEVYAATHLDCNDGDDSVNPAAAEEACNGLDDDCDEATVDAPDQDADGWSACEDCNDLSDAVHPNAGEIGCNGIDDDCDPLTDDIVDVDMDGETSCTDCDDTDERRSTHFAEDCGDKLDNDCDDVVDEDCATDWTGVYFLEAPVSYSCAFGIGININLSTLTVTDNNPIVYVSGGSGQPGTMTGSFTGDDTISAQNVLSGSCTETWSVNGAFSEGDYFEGTLYLTVSGSGCFDCTNQFWPVSGWR